MKISSSFTNKFFSILELSFVFSIFLISSVHIVKAQATFNFNYTGSAQTWVVPSGVTSVLIECWGAEGANASDRLPGNSTGGLGGYAKGLLTVSPGQTLYINVGGAGSNSGTGGFNGGGNGGFGQAGSSCFGGYAGGGGGASDVRLGTNNLINRKIVAGGGGGAGRDYCNGTCQPCGCGGAAGGAGGLDGINGAAAYNCGYSYPGSGINGGTGGSQIGGGVGGPGDGGGASGFAGTSGSGGNGANGLYDVAGGGGGGGYYGGGGGGGAINGSGVGGGGGAGGSSFIGMVNDGLTQSAVRTGDGFVKITLSCVLDITCPPDVTVNAAPNSCLGYAAVGLPEVSGCGHNGLDFDGIDDGVTVASGYSGSDEITIEMWINPRVKNDWDVFINHDTWNVNGKIHYQFTPGGTIEFAVFGNNPTNQHASVSPGVNQWNHIAAVYSKVGKYVRFYLNGVFTNQANYSVAQTIGTFPFKIGNWDGVSRFFDGKIDEIRIWNVLRTQAEISSNMNKCLEGNEPGLVAYFSCNHGVANGSNAGVTTLEDQCPAGGTTNGTLNNFALTGASSNWVPGAPAVLPSTTNNYNNSPDASDNYPVGKNKVTWTASDCEGNSATCQMTITVNGCNAPIQVYHSDTTENEAKINWNTQDDCPNGFRLRIRKELSPGVWGSWSSWTNKSGPGLKHLFTGLMHSSFYHYQIQSKCSGVNSISINGWFHTLVPPPPLKKSDKDITEDVFVFDKVDEQRNSGESSIAQILAIPNPASEFCTLQLQGFDKQSKTVTMLDLFGKMVFRVKLPASENNPELDLRKLNVQNGSYLFHVDDGQNRKTVQLIIQR